MEGNPKAIDKHIPINTNFINGGHVGIFILFGKPKFYNGRNFTTLPKEFQVIAAEFAPKCVRVERFRRLCALPQNLFGRFYPNALSVDIRLKTTFFIFIRHNFRSKAKDLKKKEVWSLLGETEDLQTQKSSKSPLDSTQEMRSVNIPATLFYRNLRKLKYLTKFRPYGLWFNSDAKNGKLPGYVVVEQRYMDSKLEPANDDHPSHDVYQGQVFVKEVYETLRASPQWNETMLVITYDEHGGFFDHVPTPVRGVPSPDGIVGQEPFYFKFDRLGVRVPTIVVSPWIEKGTVVHGPKGSPSPTSEYEHSSIPATVKKIFNLTSPFLTKRDEWAGTFEGIIQTRTQPRTDCPEQLPTPVKIRQTEANEDAKISEFRQELVQLAAVTYGGES
ncbi:hypothetical protein RJ639_022950 [Escallonia herrerae]|uniref:Phosphoesterase n=1 Tax=Escallonia herrerae TaxID=1293975 RepID=A0AA89ACZ4_9ASTE|nr:hypothetical protein RJ639_022950 [Escallonia herrerae]